MTTTSPSRVARRFVSATQWASVAVLLAVGVLAGTAAQADEAAIRKNITKRLAEFPKINHAQCRIFNQSAYTCPFAITAQMRSRCGGGGAREVATTKSLW